MALLYRVKQAKLDNLSHHFKRLYFQIHGPSFANHQASKGIADYCSNRIIKPRNVPIYPRPGDLFSSSVRFFAVPVQVISVVLFRLVFLKFRLIFEILLGLFETSWVMNLDDPQFQKKVEVKEPPKGHRLNDQIKAEFVRLVTDEGHGVVSRREALERAKSLKLDLVEVDKNAKPPVCKIMDYHKERYIREVKVKERSKIKAQGSLKKGDCKEVRFSAKTILMTTINHQVPTAPTGGRGVSACKADWSEAQGLVLEMGEIKERKAVFLIIIELHHFLPQELKDLKMKADMAKRLMERGYRVKCMSVGTEDQDLAGLLFQLSAMIEDVAFVETGPKVERKQAYIIVRHVKFGPSKKGAKKATNIGGATSSETQKDPNSAADVEEEETCSEVSDMDNDDEVDSPLQWREETMWSVSDAKDDFNKLFDHNRDMMGTGGHADKQIKFDERTASPAASNMGAGFSQSRMPNFRTPNVGPSMQETENRYARNMKNNASSRQFEPRTNFSAPVRHPERAGGRSSQSTGFGIFSAPKTDASEKCGSGAEVNQPSDGNSFVRRHSGPGNSGTVTSGGGQGSGIDDSGKYGIFSRKCSNSTPGRS
ncbi:hypothetical protein Cgig2_014725 [Carnegiea gigantea]|uniref:Translation initiation factor 3 N-terminal domain-containing protein n=1 Tax=Carnegiea gigantea TaxID=171969 RepID=A0A9Q1L004_9CARY|nr:hypothetical protein Cgig2_014725 [Carnegiea gigantea]